jgi:hypothetical protein
VSLIGGAWCLAPKRQGTCIPSGSPSQLYFICYLLNPKSIRNKAIEDDNIFDALIAAVLGVLAVTNSKAVKLYGSLSAGAMLLPVTEDFDKALGELSAR